MTSREMPRAKRSERDKWYRNAAMCKNDTTPLYKIRYGIPIHLVYYERLKDCFEVEFHDRGEIGYFKNYTECLQLFPFVEITVPTADVRNEFTYIKENI